MVLACYITAPLDTTVTRPSGMVRFCTSSGCPTGIESPLHVLSPGRKLGPYEIVSAIGAGGMGEVYRARDDRLNRQVALKVLPPHFAAAADRLARFRQEAQVLASLNHSNIAHIHGIEDADGLHALVMELVEGDDLAQRLRDGPIPLDEALPIAHQIASGIEAAHEGGVVHRDLKPANIKVRPDGTVKVLDFGLAKAFDPPASSPSGADSPTMLRPLTTGVGIVIGTAAYMSPEQARGRTVDKRTDIWAFGCVLYEMLSGRRAFGADNVADLLVAVVTREVDWTLLPSGTPPRLVGLLKRCLAKDPRERLHDIADARLEIDDVLAGKVDHAGDPRPSSSPPQRAALVSLGAAAGAGLLGLIVASGVWPPSPTADARELRVSIVHADGRDVGAPVISPDGGRVAYGARRPDGTPLLWVRDLASGETRALSGTEDATVPFWSPDSRELGFTQGGRVKRVPADGGPLQVVSSQQAGPGGAWGADGTILVNGGDLNPIFMIAPNGTTAPATRLPSPDWSHHWPSFLPDGRRFLFTAKLWTQSAEASEQGVFLGTLGGLEARRLLPDLSSAVYAPPGILVFVRDGVLTAVPFDLSAGRVTGPPTPIGGSVAVDESVYLAGVSAAADGTLAVRAAPAVSLIGGGADATFHSQLRAVERTGGGAMVGAVERYNDAMQFHPDGRRLAAAIVDPRSSTQDIWLIDLENGGRSALTSTRGFALRPVWSPDGSRVAFGVQPAGRLDDVHIRDLRTGRVTPLLETDAYEDPVAWSRDGEHLLVYRVEMAPPPQPYGLFVWSFKSRALTPFVPNGVARAAFSPDKRYVAFTSDQTGRDQSYVTTFPDRRETWTLTTDGGSVLGWSADGREILVASGSGHVVSYAVSTGDDFIIGPPTILVRDVGSAARHSAPTPDHSRILIRVSPNAASDRGEMRLLFGWAVPWQMRR